MVCHDGSTSGRMTQAAARQIDDFITVPNSRQGRREARLVARTADQPIFTKVCGPEWRSRQLARRGGSSASRFPKSFRSLPVVQRIETSVKQIHFEAASQKKTSSHGP